MNKQGGGSPKVLSWASDRKNNNKSSNKNKSSEQNKSTNHTNSSSKRNQRQQSPRLDNDKSNTSSDNDYDSLDDNKSNDDGSSSVYLTDNDPSTLTSSGNEENSTSVNTTTSSSSSSGGIDDEGVSDSGSSSGWDDEAYNKRAIALDFSFIRAKQRILKRAADVFMNEDGFDALAVLAERKRKKLDPSLQEDSTIWDEAKEILKEISYSNVCDGSSWVATSDVWNTSSIHDTSTDLANKLNKTEVKNNTTTTTRPSQKIDTKTVERKLATAYDNNDDNVKEEDSHSCTNKDKSATVRRTLPSNNIISPSLLSTSTRHWMTKTLLWNCPYSTFTSRPTFEDNNNNRAADNFYSPRRPAPSSIVDWKVASDPLTCSVGLLLPRSMHLQEHIDLNYALTITDEARIVAQSTPPNRVVHVNKAFLVLSGLSCNDVVLGKPFEQVIKITSDLRPTVNIDSKQEVWSGNIVVATDDEHQACNLTVTPILNTQLLKSDYSRISGDGLQIPSSVSSSSSQIETENLLSLRTLHEDSHRHIMSHLLVRVFAKPKEDRELSMIAVEDDNDDMAVSVTADDETEQLQQQSKTSNSNARRSHNSHNNNNNNTYSSTDNVWGTIG